MSHSVGIYLYPGVEVLDFAGPYEVFTTANRVFARQGSSTALPFEVFTVAAAPDLVRARAGLLVKPDFTRWIADIHGQSLLTASVCTGAFLLGKAGVLEGRAVTSHWEDVADLRAMFPCEGAGTTTLG